MKVRVTREKRGFNPETTSVDVVEGSIDEFRSQVARSWEHVPAELNPGGYYGSIHVAELARMTADERAALVRAALAQSCTKTEEFEV